MRLGKVFRALVDSDAPVAFRAYDGSATGPRDPLATIEVCSPEAVRFMLTAPGQLGVARAYVTGALEVHGDLHATLHALHAHRRRDLHASELLRLLRGFEMGLMRRPPVPAEEAPPAWRRGLARHSRRRDAPVLPTRRRCRAAAAPAGGRACGRCGRASAPAPCRCHRPASGSSRTNRPGADRARARRSRWRHRSGTRWPCDRSRGYGAGAPSCAERTWGTDEPPSRP